MKPNFIAGEWRESDRVYRNINPSDVSDCVDTYAVATPADVAVAVGAAKRAFAEWSLSTPQQRFTALDFVGSEILARKDELGRLLAREEGKVLPEATGEVVRAGQIFKFFAGEAVRNSGEHIPSVRPGVEIDTFRQPIGVVALITPWNFPIAIPAWKSAPALAFGNTVVLKPAELTPGCAWEMADIISRSGIPNGAFNLVMGKGSVIGEPLVANPDIAGVSFTGSIGVGSAIAKTCAERLAKVQLEMGGKNPLVVLDDADLDTAVNAAINGSFYSTGQRCTASSRLIVTSGIHDRFVAAMVVKMKTLVVDDALAPGTEIGPVVDETQLKKNLEYVGIGKKEGAKLAIGGEPVSRNRQGFYMAPALFTETQNSMTINRDEIFGPVASVVRVRDYDEALAVANDTPFGLTSGICTTSLKYASHFKANAQSGMVMVNLPTAGVDYHVPFGGRKGSSYGSREQGRAAVEFYTTVKTCYIAP
jgi:acyl-CoA reductase-like NAD-dependent aldehyde dehydrogenase